MISTQISDKLSFWVTSSYETERIIGAMSVYMEALYALGYTSGSAFVGNGVHELDTGYEAFGKAYNSFEDMKEHLCSDFRSEEDELDGSWLNTLNFGDIIVDLTKNGSSYTLGYSRGVIELDCGTDEAAIEERCHDAIEPYLWKAPAPKSHHEESANGTPGRKDAFGSGEREEGKTVSLAENAKEEKKEYQEETVGTATESEENFYYSLSQTYKPKDEFESSEWREDKTISPAENTRKTKQEFQGDTDAAVSDIMKSVKRFNDRLPQKYKAKKRRAGYWADVDDISMAICSFIVGMFFMIIFVGGILEGAWWAILLLFLPIGLFGQTVKFVAAVVKRHKSK